MIRLKSMYRTLGLLVTIILIFPAVLFAFQNEPDGFRGMKWGTSISELSDFTLKDGKGETKIYVKKNDKMKIGDSDIDGISYVFYKDKFYGVMIRFRNITNFIGIKETCQQLYGSGYRPNRFMKNYLWHGSNVTVYLKYSEITKDGTLVYTDKNIAQEKKADETVAAKQAADDL